MSVSEKRKFRRMAHEIGMMMKMTHHRIMVKAMVMAMVLVLVLVTVTVLSRRRTPRRRRVCADPSAGGGHPQG